jgi:hypothetical protein
VARCEQTSVLAKAGGRVWRVRMQSNRPRANKLEADGVEVERERRPCEWLRKCASSARTGAVRSRRVSS